MPFGGRCLSPRVFALVALVATLAMATATSANRAASAAPAPAAPPDSAAANSAALDPAAPERTSPLDGLPIRSVVIRTHGVFDPMPGGALRPVYGLVNALHIRTRPSTIRSQLLFAPGERWSEARARETARNLRALYFVDPERIEATRDGDSVDVVVETRDNWTTEPEFELSGGGGRLVGSVVLLERNLLGLGKLVQLSYRESLTKIERSVLYEDPGLGGTHARLEASAGNETSGSAASLWLGLPFYAEDTPWSYWASWDRSDSRSHLFVGDTEVERFDNALREGEAALGRGWRHGATLHRLTGTFAYRDRRFGESQALTGAGPLVGGGVEDLRTRRVAVEGLLWRPAHVVRRRVERLDGLEDFDLGRLARVKVGWSPHALGGSADEGYGEAEVRAGAQAGAAGFGWLDANASSRMRTRPLESLLQLEARWVNQRLPHQTWVFGVDGVAGSRMARDFQVILGSLEGLRGYPAHALTGDRAWRANVEDRVAGPREVLGLVSVGAAVFYDGAMASGPGSHAGLWLHDVGAGLRLSFPRSSHKRVARFDVAWPLRTTPETGAGAVFSFGAEQAF